MTGNCREIKFRAWDEINNKWIDDCDLIMESNGCVWAGDVNNPPMVQIENGNVTFYTGLKDKNDKEIYEGDILLFNNSHNDRNNKWVCVVEYREGSFVCGYPKDEVYNHFDAWNVPKVTWEVIGNIYENPELLEVQHD